MIVGKLIVSGVCATVTNLQPITSGMVGHKIELEFADPEWSELTKTVVFKSFCTRDVVAIDGIITIPHEVLRYPRRNLLVGISGTDAQGALVIPTVWASLGEICEGTDSSGDPSTDPTLPVWAQLHSMIGELSQLSTEERTSLVAAINEVARLISDVDLTNYATEKWVTEGYQPKGNYLTEHQDISGKLDTDKLPEAVNDALAQAKESGEFDGEPGYTPVKGVDYYTDADKAEMVASVLAALPAAEEGSY